MPPTKTWTKKTWVYSTEVDYEQRGPGTWIHVDPKYL